MDDLLWKFEKRLEILWEMEASGESVAETAARHGISVDLLMYWKALYDAVSTTKLSPAALSAVKVALEQQTARLEELTSALQKERTKQ